MLRLGVAAIELWFHLVLWDSRCYLWVVGSVVWTVIGCIRCSAVWCSGSQ